MFFKRNSVPLTIGVSVAALGASGALTATAYAQGDIITQCETRSADDAERIACLEEAIRRLSAIPVAPAPIGEAPLSSAPMASNGADGADAPVGPTAAMAQNTATEAAQGDQPTGLGAEQVMARRDRQALNNSEPTDKAKDDELTVNVTEYAVAANGDYIFYLDNGHTWRQTGRPNGRLRLYPNKGYTVTIKKGMLSGFRMTVNETKRTFVAERIQ